MGCIGTCSYGFSSVFVRNRLSIWANLVSNRVRFLFCLLGEAIVSLIDHYQQDHQQNLFTIASASFGTGQVQFKPNRVSNFWSRVDRAGYVTDFAPKPMSRVRVFGSGAYAHSIFLGILPNPPVLLRVIFGLSTFLYVASPFLVRYTKGSVYEQKPVVVKNKSHA